MDTSKDSDDLATKTLPFWALWGGPIGIMLSMNFLRLPLVWTTIILAACLAWMGVGCAINARRCHRRHCYYSSPILLAGAAATLLVGFNIVNLGPYGLMYVTWGTFALVLLTFLPEKLFGKYVNRRPN